jgi:5'-nucleotidase
MGITLQDKLVVALSSRALFNFEEENRIFEAAGSQDYVRLQLDRINQPAEPGVAFPLVKKLLEFNADGQHRVEVVILSRNDPSSGLRVFYSARAAHLALERGVFTQGRSPFQYLRPLGAKLFLSANEDDVRQALLAGFPAARVFPESVKAAESHPQEIRIAFDGDAVLFSDDSERVFKEQGLNAFQSHEAQHAQTPLPPGPFKPLLDALHSLQQVAGDLVPIRIRTALVTARSAPAHERAIRTLMDWRISVDEAMFLGGLEKGPFLQEFEPDFFFDDQTRHCESAVTAGPTGHVVHGVANSQ